MPAPPTVACPQCSAAVVWTPASTWRPFCSERCKMIDLGAWANETYRVQATEPDEEEEFKPGTSSDARSGLRDD
jgi:endogenous inhibitor of DNA gyrase (YacG/DUF329 family)